MSCAAFTWRGVVYSVSGGWDSESGSYGGPTALSFIVERSDGKPIRGARMHPGMVQLGLSRGLSSAAERALRAEMAADRLRDADQEMNGADNAT